MTDLQNHIDKVFEQYNNRFRGFEILFAVVIGSGIVLLAAPLGKYYFMYIELQGSAEVAVAKPLTIILDDNHIGNLWRVEHIGNVYLLNMLMISLVLVSFLSFT